MVNLAYLATLASAVLDMTTASNLKMGYVTLITRHWVVLCHMKGKT